MPYGDWVLILTLVFSGYKSGGAAIETIPMFPTRADCVAAGNAWLKQNHKHDVTALCVHRGEDQ